MTSKMTEAWWNSLPEGVKLRQFVSELPALLGESGHREMYGVELQHGENKLGPINA